MSTTIHFPDDFLPHVAMWRTKGFANLEVTHNGARYRLSFVDPGTITQGLSGQGEDAGHFAKRGMVTVQEISEGLIRSAMAKLAKTGYFDTLAPVGGGG